MTNRRLSHGRTNHGRPSHGRPSHRRSNHGRTNGCLAWPVHACLAVLIALAGAGAAGAQGDDPSATAANQEARSELELDVQLLVLKSNWSEGQDAEQAAGIQRDLDKVFEGVELPTEVRETLIGQAATIMFPRDFGAVYSNADFQRNLAWWKQHDLIVYQQDSRKATPPQRTDNPGLPGFGGSGPGFGFQSSLALAIRTMRIPEDKIPLSAPQYSPSNPNTSFRNAWNTQITVSEVESYSPAAGGAGAFDPDGGAAAGPSNGPETSLSIEFTISFVQQQVLAYPREQVVNERSLARFTGSYIGEENQTVVIAWPNPSHLASHSPNIPLLVISTKSKASDSDAEKSPEPALTRAERMNKIGIQDSSSGGFNSFRDALAGRRSPRDAPRETTRPKPTDSKPESNEAVDAVALVILQRVKAETVAKRLRELFPDQRDAITVAPESNQLLIGGMPTDKRLEILDALGKLDQAVPQSESDNQPPQNMIGLPTPSRTVTPSELDAARRAYAAAEQAARTLADQLRSPDASPAERKKFAEKLAPQVRTAFQARLDLQRMEAESLRGRLAEIEANLARREALADEICARRVDQLLDDPALRWDAAADLSTVGGSAEATDSANVADVADNGNADTGTAGTGNAEPTDEPSALESTDTIAAGSMFSGEMGGMGPIAESIGEGTPYGYPEEPDQGVYWIEMIASPTPPPNEVSDQPAVALYLNGAAITPDGLIATALPPEDWKQVKFDRISVIVPNHREPQMARMLEIDPTTGAALLKVDVKLSPIHSLATSPLAQHQRLNGLYRADAGSETTLYSTVVNLVADEDGAKLPLRYKFTLQSASRAASDLAGSPLFSSKRLEGIAAHPGLNSSTSTPGANGALPGGEMGYPGGGFGMPGGMGYSNVSLSIIPASVIAKLVEKTEQDKPE